MIINVRSADVVDTMDAMVLSISVNQSIFAGPDL